MRRLLGVLGVAAVFLALGWIARDRGMLAGLLDRRQGPASLRSPEASGQPGKALLSAHGPVALGRIEPATKVIDISAPPGDRLQDLRVEENSEVRKNDVLATLESHALRKLEVDSLRAQIRSAEGQQAAEKQLSEARVQAARAALSQAEAYELDVKVQESRLAVLKRNLELARNVQRRLYAVQSGVVSIQDREQQDLAVQKAEAELKAAEVLLEKARRTGPLSVQSAKADLEAAVASQQQVHSAVSLESLKKQEELAVAQWERSVLRAPCDGTVLKIFVRPGEATGGTPILQMADCRRMVVVAEVYETEVKRIRVGQKATIHSRAFPAPYDETGLTGTVSRIGKTIAPAEMKKLDPLAETDRHVVEVRIDLDAQASKVAAELVHLQVEVRFAP